MRDLLPLAACQALPGCSGLLAGPHSSREANQCATPLLRAAATTVRRVHQAKRMQPAERELTAVVSRSLRRALQACSVPLVARARDLRAHVGGHGGDRWAPADKQQAPQEQERFVWRGSHVAGWHHFTGVPEPWQSVDVLEDVRVAPKVCPQTRVVHNDVGAGTTLSK